MKEARYSHACGVVNQSHILVAGGRDNIGNVIVSTEMYSLALEEWRDSTPLPDELTTTVSIQYDKSVLVFGSMAIYQYNEVQNLWAMRDESLSSERSAFVGIPIEGTSKKLSYKGFYVQFAIPIIVHKFFFREHASHLVPLGPCGWC